jgi:hypothetical protein
MAQIQIEIADDLHEWAKQTAAENQLSLDAYLEVLLALESGLRRSARDGRLLRTRASVYRGSEAYFVPQETEAS